MKQLKCATCEYMAKGNSVEDVMSKMWNHVKKAHPKIAEKEMKKPKEERDRMMEETKMRIQDVP